MRYLFTSLLIATGISTAYAADTPTTILPISTNTITATKTPVTTLNPSFIEMQTNVGTITMELNWDKAPISSKNFLDYTNKGFYKNTLFHRTVNTGYSIVQGGGIDAQTTTQKVTSAPIINESYNKLSNLKGTVGMARTDKPNTATSQFFFNFTDNLAFDKSGDTDDKAGYAVFANVISGLDIVTKIGNLNRVKTLYSEGVPYINSVIDCGFNFCLKKIFIENMYTSKVVDNINSITRVTVNGTGGKVTSTPAGINCTSTSKAGSKTCVLTKPFGTDVSLTFTSSKGYELRDWSGDCKIETDPKDPTKLLNPLPLTTKITDATTKVTTPKNNNCTATFAKIGS